MKKLLLSAITAAALSANDSELQALKAQMAQMEQMMKAMQQKIVMLENEKPVQTADFDHFDHSDHDEHDEHKISMGGVDLSLVVDTSYVVRSKKDEQLIHLQLPGIAHGLIGGDTHTAHNHPTYNAQNGFNLNYAEIALHHTLHTDLDAEALFHFSDGAVEIEEAFLSARNLPYGFEVKGGKFLSNFGYLNHMHHHEWDFSDMPLVYEAFLGNHGINEIGAQLQWIAPTNTYLMVGAEALQGKNEAMFGHAAIANPYVPEVSLSASAHQPSLFVGYVKTAANLGKSVIQAGASIARGNSRLDHFSDETPYALSGKSDLYGLDFTLKHTFDTSRVVLWQSEWLYRDIEGTQFNGDGSAITDITAMRKKQAGYYTQLVYAHNENWRIGGRYDTIYRNTISDPALYAPENMDQFSGMVEYNDHSLARYRLQYTHSNAFFNEALERQNLDSLIFSVNFTLGEHTDHTF